MGMSAGGGIDRADNIFSLFGNTSGSILIFFWAHVDFDCLFGGYRIQHVKVSI